MNGDIKKYMQLIRGAHKPQVPALLEGVKFGNKEKGYIDSISDKFNIGIEYEFHPHDMAMLGDSDDNDLNITDHEDQETIDGSLLEDESFESKFGFEGIWKISDVYVDFDREKYYIDNYGETDDDEEVIAHLIGTGKYENVFVSDDVEATQNLITDLESTFNAFIEDRLFDTFVKYEDNENDEQLELDAGSKADVYTAAIFNAVSNELDEFEHLHKILKHEGDWPIVRDMMLDNGDEVEYVLITLHEALIQNADLSIPEYIAKMPEEEKKEFVKAAKKISLMEHFYIRNHYNPLKTMVDEHTYEMYINQTENIVDILDVYGVTHVDKTEGEHDQQIEVITGIMNLDIAKSNMKNMFRLISDHGRTSDSSGMHVSISSNEFKDNAFDALKFLILMQTDYLHNYDLGGFEPRHHVPNFNSAVMEVFEKIKRRLIIDIIDDVSENTTVVGIVEGILRRVDLGHIAKEKYQSINMGEFKIRNGRIELRFFGGQDYEDRYDEILNHIYRSLYLLEVTYGNLLQKEYNKSKMKYAVKMYEKAMGMGLLETIQLIRAIQKQAKIKSFDDISEHIKVAMSNHQPIYGIGKYNQVEVLELLHVMEDYIGVE